MDDEGKCDPKQQTLCRPAADLGDHSSDCAGVAAMKRMQQEREISHVDVCGEGSGARVEAPQQLEVDLPPSALEINLFRRRRVFPRP